MKFKSLVTGGLLLIGGLWGASAAVEGSETVTLSAPDFLIPLGGQSSTLDVFYDGRPPEVSGYDVLGSQKVFVRANSQSAGMVTLNLHLPGFTSSDPESIISSASLQFKVRDLDFFPDQFAPGITLRETAAITAINGVQLVNPLNFFDYLPTGTRDTDGKEITLNPISLSQPGMPVVNFSEPFVLSFTFTAMVTSRGLRSYDLYNAAESIASDIQLTLSPAPPPVPEPSTLVIGTLGAFVVAWKVLRNRREKSATIA